jgi:hypothetical protein
MLVETVTTPEPIRFSIRAEDITAQKLRAMIDANVPLENIMPVQLAWTRALDIVKADLGPEDGAKHIILAQRARRELQLKERGEQR